MPTREGRDSSGPIQLWELESSHRAPALRAHSGRAASVEFGPSGRGVWTAGWDGTLRRLALDDALKAVGRPGLGLP